jgi:dihydroxyacetone kinase-like protein
MDRTYEWLERAFIQIKENEARLTDMDRAIGDGDHGANMVRGMEAALEGARSAENRLKAAGMAIMSVTGGAAGSLYGSALHEASKNVKAIESLEDVKRVSEIMLGKIKSLGGARVGDKTIVDVLEPFTIALGDGKSFDEALAIAEEAMNNTRDIVARKGRASYLGERSRGTIDPGACSMYLMLKSFEVLWYP